MAFNIDNFSTYFCLVFSSSVTIPPELDLESFQLGVEPETLSEVISILHEMFRRELKIVIEELMSTDKGGFQPFMESVIGKCMKISEKKSTYAHFLLVCTLINGIISDSLEDTECFLVPKVCSCCLVSVYDRCYKDYFDNRDEGDTFDFHIGVLKKHLATQKSLDDKRKVPIFGENNASTVIGSLVDAVDIPLGDYEQRMLNDILSSVPVELLDGRLPSSESSSSRDISTEDATENALMHEDSSESTSKPSESSSCRDISTQDVTECMPMYEDSSESTNKPSEASSGKNINTEDETECVPMYEDPSESTSRSSESEPSSSYRDTNPEDSKKRVSLKKDYLYYKNRICDVCGGRCANLMVSYIENILEKCGN